MLVPAKYTVSSPLFENGGEPGAHDELAEFEAAAVAAGIPTINLKPLLQDAAAAGLNHKHYVYSQTIRTGTRTESGWPPELLRRNWRRSSSLG